MRESGMTNSEPPGYNSISTTEVAQIKIAKDGFHRMQFIRSASISLRLPEFLIVNSQILVQVAGRTFHC